MMERVYLGESESIDEHESDLTGRQKKRDYNWVRMI